MKTRAGFVSNSSSSSFIVAFPEKPTTVSETALILFKKDLDELSRSKLSIVIRIFHDIKQQNNSGNIKEVANALGNMFADFDYGDFEEEDVLNFLEANKDSFIFIGEYEDKDSTSAAIESDNPFQSLPHLYQSNH